MFVCFMVNVNKSEVNLKESILSFHHVDPRIKLRSSCMVARPFPAGSSCWPHRLSHWDLGHSDLAGLLSLRDPPVSASLYWTCKHVPPCWIS